MFGLRHLNTELLIRDYLGSTARWNEYDIFIRLIFDARETLTLTTLRHGEENIALVSKLALLATEIFRDQYFSENAFFF